MLVIRKKKKKKSGRKFNVEGSAGTDHVVSENSRLMVPFAGKQRRLLPKVNIKSNRREGANFSFSPAFSPKFWFDIIYEFNWKGKIIPRFGSTRKAFHAYLPSRNTAQEYFQDSLLAPPRPSRFLLSSLFSPPPKLSSEEARLDRENFFF